MSGTLPPIDPMADTRDGLADEISDVIDQHAGGLDAETLWAKVEQVASRLEEDLEEEVSLGELEYELCKFVDEHCQQMPRGECIEVLEVIAEDLESAPLTPRVEMHDIDRAARNPQLRPTLVLRFESAFGLRRNLPKLLDMRGYFVETPHRPPTRDNLTVEVTGSQIDESVALDGQVVRTAPNGITLRIYQPSPDVSRRLRALPAKMRRRRLE